jgi:hypothetical protein
MGGKSMVLRHEKELSTLKSGSSSDREITSWLDTLHTRLQIPVRRIDDRHWQVDIHNDQAGYTLHIKDQDPWITYGIELIPDVVGIDQDRADFYRKALNLSARLNGAKVGLEDNRLVVTREEPKGNVNQINFYQSITIMNNAVVEVISDLYPIIKQNGLKFNPQIVTDQTKPRDRSLIGISVKTLEKKAT